MTIFGDGSQTRSFCFVTDLVEALWHLVRSDYTGPVICGNPHELSIREFAAVIAEEMDVELKSVERPLPEDDPKVRRPDITLAREILGWEPHVAFREGIRQTIEYFRSQSG